MNDGNGVGGGGGGVGVGSLAGGGVLQSVKNTMSRRWVNKLGRNTPLHEMNKSFRISEHFQG